MISPPDSTDIALIGAGPLGLEIAVALKQAQLRYTHFDAAQIGATIQWWAPATRWFSSPERISIAGVPLITPHQEKASREEYLAYLRSIVLQFHLHIHTYTRVTAITRTTDHRFHLTLQQSVRGLPLGQPASLTANRVILSTGGTERPNLLHVPGEDLPHVSHYFQDPHAYFQKNLLIVGGRNSAVEAALRCHRAGAHVHFSYRRDSVDPKDIKYWLYPEFSSLINSGQITPHFNTTVAEISPTHVTLSNSQLPITTYQLPMDFLLLMTGYEADMSLAQMAGVHLTGDQLLPTYNPDTMQTNIPNLYVAGTAIAGTQCRYKVFLENCHAHVPKILAHLTGHSPPPAAAPTPLYERPES
ncbi:MAG TPA: NAD(P)-binding domain-containing protein [Phycisphaerae bacterium]|nr:NAD(P)-binding domain-containing protein [Phycisphaerae bacterium]